MLTVFGYEPGERTFDGSALVGRAGFWAAYLGPMLGAELDSELAELFGAPVGMVRGCYLRLSDSAGWPVFPVALRGGGGLAVVFRNVEGEEAVDFLVLPGDGEAIRIATAEGPVDGPGLSWGELVAVAGDDPRAMLLLAPLLGDHEARSPAALSQLAGALRAVGVGEAGGVGRVVGVGGAVGVGRAGGVGRVVGVGGAGDVDEAGGAEIAGDADKSGGVGGVDSAGGDNGAGGKDGGAERIAGMIAAGAPAGWWRGEDGVLVCDHPRSVRNPDGWDALGAADLRTVSRLLDLHAG